MAQTKHPALPRSGESRLIDYTDEVLMAERYVERHGREPDADELAAFVVDYRAAMCDRDEGER